MNSTIGEIVNVIVNYTTRLTVSVFNGCPYIIANIGGESGTTRLYMYIIQTAEHIYGTAVSDDIYNGERFIPSNISGIPFIREKKFLGEKSKDNNVESNIHARDFENWFYRKLYKFNIIIFNPDNFKQRVAGMGFNSLKIRKTIGRTFALHNCKSGTIRELVNIANNEGEFELPGLVEKEIKCVCSKLSNYGLHTAMKGNNIIGIKFERRN